MNNTHSYDIEALLDYSGTTDKQRIVLETLKECGSIKGTAEILERNKRSVQNMLSGLNKKYLRDNTDAMIPEGQMLKGRTDHYKMGDDGKYVKDHFYIKTEKSKEEDILDAFKIVLENMLKNEEIKTPKKIKSPSSNDSDTMSVYTIGDAHVGMLAWDKETGADNDLITVQADLLSAMSLLIEQAHTSEEAFIVDVGDWFHSDNQNNTTSNSGNNLDVDGRYPKVLQIGLDLTIKLIDMALSKHKIVRWRSAIGNHNEHSAIMMTAFIKAWYRNEPRVIVHDTPSMFMYHSFGKNLIGITHGHTAKAEKLGEIMSVDCEDIWSGSKYRYWYTGHIHHQSVKEFTSCVVETFRTLAGKDAWHSGAGYRSGQDMRSITLHKDFGEISRNTVSLAMARNKDK